MGTSALIVCTTRPKKPSMILVLSPRGKARVVISVIVDYNEIMVREQDKTREDRTMNTQKAQEAISNIVLKNRLDRQYPASKAQLARLTELGIIDLMPICKHPSVKAIGHTDAKLVIAAAEDNASDLYKALHDVEPAPEPETTEDEDEQTEVASYSFEDGEGEDVSYIVYREGSRYTVAAEWSDGPAWIGNIEPTEAEVEAIHLDYLQTIGLQDLLQKQEESILDQVMTVAEVANSYGLTRDAVNKACQRNGIPWRRSGNTLLILRTDAEARWRKRTQHVTVTNKSGKSLNYAAAVSLMDDELREDLHDRMDQSSEQEFFTAYEAAHLEKFGAEWELSKANPTW